MSEMGMCGGPVGAVLISLECVRVCGGWGWGEGLMGTCLHLVFV